MQIKFLCVLTVFALCFSPFHSFSASTDVYRSVATTEKKIALTFDDGPHYKYTEKVLDILEKYGVKATFFVIGVNAERHPDKVKLISSLGHEIGNHTYSHPHLKKVTAHELEAEIQRASEVICKLTGKTPVLFRPPEGYCCADVSDTAKKIGCEVILWSHDTRDWAHTPSEEISKNILDSVGCGDIILFHDFITPDTPTPKTLETVIPKLIERGYEFVTVSELISLG